ncbi:LCP family protein [Salisediminibacterium halotolerans]|uniref:Cell envelope-related function transcriptional attenuator common domain-containing protein n=1 Tax=Salisediminibacterium halotolerans TaxID=517425 RepID=A0A1H9TVD7_9BACI|nr:LCP family protein [Salisediminibacterium haloalkalitolerans]SES01340.1 cell envelope-related function transcriptional attenuator common domain-containing protein [Salisediminibacterium haloalkalitolerans]
MGMSRYNDKKTTKPRKKRIWKIALLAFLLVFAVAGAGLAYVMNQVSSVAESTQQELERGERSEYRDVDVDPREDPVSVLFLGLDTRDGDLSGLTDAMILVTFNPDDESVKMLNIPRDSLVDIPGRAQTDKINHAHAFGGIDLTLDTVEGLLDVPVDYFVSVNFDAFMEVVDEVGGIDVDAPMEVRDTDNATYGEIVIPKGEQTLDGEEALAYARMRKHDPEGDIGRGKRQKEIIESLIHETANVSNLTSFQPLLDTVERNTEMNIDFDTMMSLHHYADSLAEIESLNLDGSGIMRDDIYYYQLDEESLHDTRQRLKLHLEMIDEAEEYAPEQAPAEHEQVPEEAPVEEEPVEQEPNSEWEENEEQEQWNNAGGQNDGYEENYDGGAETEEAPQSNSEQQPGGQEQQPAENGGLNQHNEQAPAEEDNNAYDEEVHDW